MEVGNKRNRDAEDDDPDDLDEQADNGLRRRLISVICALLTVTHIFMGTKSIEPVHKCCAPLLELDMRGICNEDGNVEAIFLPAMHFPRDLWARILATDMYCVDSTRKSEQPFWDTCRGRKEDWYKEYRMSQATFIIITRDCVPFLYSRPTYSLQSARFRYLRSKVVTTLIRYLAIQSDQHTLGKEFGVRQACVSKRLERGHTALLSAYWYQGCPNPKISFPLEAGRREVARWFVAKCGIPYLCGSIDGSIIKISTSFCVGYIPREFCCKRKKHTL